jgi:hypothetical protein
MANSTSRWLAFARILIGTTMLAAAAKAAEPDNTQILLDLLVKRGVLSASDAAAYAKQIQAPAAAAPAQMSASANAAPANAPVLTSAASSQASPLSFKIGIADFTPFGFMDFTTLYRSTLNGGDIGSSFGSIPYGNTANGQLSETRFSAKNSRLGLRVDSTVGDTKVLGYVETDFLGNAATNINVASNSDVMRMRVYFVDLRNGDWEFLAGQDWSLMTPNRKGLSPVPGDIFYTQNVDTNYQVGLVWGRTPQLRAIYHASDEWTAGISLENPDQYVGSAVTLPAGFTTTQVDTGSNGTATPNVFPDVIGKIAYDTKLGDLPLHVDAATLIRYFKINTYTSTVDANASKTGIGGSVNANLSVMPNLQLIGNFFDGNDGGRYLSTGLGPDFIVNPVNSSGAYSLSLVNSYSGLGGLEWDVTPMSKVYGYYGMVKYGQKYDQLTASSYVGYGYPGSSNSNNKQIEEYTIGLTQTLWKNPRYGDLKVLFQASYVDRQPWYVAPAAPSKAHLGMVYVDLRYDLP